MSGQRIDEGLDARAAQLVHELSGQTGELECDFMEAHAVPVEQGAHLIMRSEILSLASSIHATSEETSQSLELLLDEAVTMLRDTVDLLADLKVAP